MVSISILGFEKFASQVWKVDRCHEISEKNKGATASRAWPRAETINGLKKVIQIVYIPGLKI